MQLTSAQLVALKADIAANTNQISFGGSMVAINALPNTPDANTEIRNWYNQFPGVDWFLWWSAVPIKNVLDKLNYANFTPNDDPNQANATAAQVWENRAMLVQIKQINLQMMLQGQATFDATKTTLRGGLQDATENLPTGNNGNNRTGGWTNIQPVLSRKASNAEKLFSTGTGSSASPATLAVGSNGAELSGGLSTQNVEDARNLV